MYLPPGRVFVKDFYTPKKSDPLAKSGFNITLLIMKRILAVFFLCGGISLPSVWALPDLTLSPSDIQFSLSSPEVNENVTITVTIRNEGDAYHDQVVSTPIAFHDDSNQAGGAVDGVLVHASDTQPLWMAQRFLSTAAVNIGKVSLFLTDMGNSDEIRLDVRKTLASSPPLPSPSDADLLARITVDSAFSSDSTSIKNNYGWQDFVPAAPIALSANATYWLSMGNFSTSSSHGYAIWRDTVTSEAEVAFSRNFGLSWSTITAAPVYNRVAYHRVYRPQDTVVRLYQGDPDAGGTLISVSTISLPLTANGTATVSTDWSVAAAGAYDIYVQVDGPGLINESDETNNKVFRSVTVAQTQARVASASAPDGALGVDPAAPLTFTFNKAMDGSTLAGAFALRAVRDDQGQSLDEAVSGTLAYDAASRTATFTPAAALEHNHRYEARWSAAAKDYLGFALSAYTAAFQTAVQKTAQSLIIGSDQRTKIQIAPGAVSFPTYFVDLEVSPSANAAVRSANNKAGTDRDAFTAPVASSLRRAVLYEGTYPGTEVSSPKFSGDVSLTVPYSDDGQGFVAGTNPRVREDTLSLYWLNETDGLWVRLPESTVDTDQNTVTARVPHLSYFVIMGQNAADLSRAYAYPVPFRPNAGLGHRRIKFTNLSPQCVIKVYTVAGELVKTIEETDGDGFNDSWDGSDAVSGAYLYIIDNGTDRKTGQLVIIR